MGVVGGVNNNAVLDVLLKERGTEARIVVFMEFWSRVKEAALLALMTDNPEDLLKVVSILEGCALRLVDENELTEFDIATTLIENALKNYQHNTKQRPPISPLRGSICAVRLLRMICNGADGDFHAALHRMTEEERQTSAVEKIMELHDALFTGKYSTFNDLAAKLAAFPGMGGLTENIRLLLRNKVARCLEAGHEWLRIEQVQKLLMLESPGQVQQFIDEFQNSAPQLLTAMSSGDLLGVAIDDESIKWVIDGDRVLFQRTEAVKTKLPSQEILTNYMNYAAELDRIV